MIIIGKSIQVTFGRKTVARLEDELIKAQALKNVHLNKVACSLLALHKGKKINDVAEILHVNQRTIYNWIELFLIGGFNWLSRYHFKGRGRKSKLTNKQKDKLYKIVEKGPEKYGYSCGIWNTAMITEVIQKEFNVMYNTRYVAVILKNIGLSFQKAKFVSDRIDDPDHVKAQRKWKRVTWPKILKDTCKCNGVILFTDEVSFAQWGSLARTWAPKGKQPTVKK